ESRRCDPRGILATTTHLVRPRPHPNHPNGAAGIGARPGVGKSFELCRKRLSLRAQRNNLFFTECEPRLAPAAGGAGQTPLCREKARFCRCAGSRGARTRPAIRAGPTARIVARGYSRAGGRSFRRGLVAGGPRPGPGPLGPRPSAPWPLAAEKAIFCKSPSLMRGPSSKCDSVVQAWGVAGPR
nr:hypothetical protein [Tanacetum cinerariifolium]